MSIKKSVEDLARIMLQQGATVDTTRNVLKALGFSDENVEQVIGTLQISGYIRENELQSAQQTDLINSYPPLVTPQIVSTELNGSLKSIQEEVGRLQLELSQLSQRVKNIENSETSGLELKVKLLEAKVDGLIDAIGEYVPTLIKRLGRGKPTLDTE
ncbi:hypothetical protein KEJ26_07015 [Candidatus Bathyarchaeota archaeon]|nr:hypothetical protein [Candidatus Bathyarchaeota archaeon]